MEPLVPQQPNETLAMFHARRCWHDKLKGLEEQELQRQKDLLNEAAIRQQEIERQNREAAIISLPNAIARLRRQMNSLAFRRCWTSNWDEFGSGMAAQELSARR